MFLCGIQYKYKKYNKSYKSGGVMKDGKGKYIFGVCKVGEKGQIVIPKEARSVFNINPGDSLLMMGDVKKGLAIIKTEVFTSMADDIMNNDK